MKQLTFMAASMVIAALFASCESSSRLASSIEGEWSGAPERITDTELSYVSMTPAYEFVRNANNNRSAGTVTLTAQIDTSMPAEGFPADSVGASPVSFSIAAVVTASGTWQAMDNDEITLKFEPSTVITSVDSRAVCEYASPMLATDSAQTVELPMTVIDTVSRQLTNTITSYVGQIRSIDDIKINGTFMKCEIGKRDYTFTKIQ